MSSEDPQIETQTSKETTLEPVKRNFSHESYELNNFLLSLDAYQSTLPEAYVNNLLRRSGVDLKDTRISKLVALAADKILVQILSEAKEVSQLRYLGNTKFNKKKHTLMNEATVNVSTNASAANNNIILDLTDVEIALNQVNVFVKKKKLDDEENLSNH